MISRSRAILAVAVVFSLKAVPANAMADHDSTSIVATIDRFHAALGAADSGAIRSLLADDVIVLESGSLETRAEYLSHHLGGDIEFARAVPSLRKLVRVNRSGSTAWVTSTSITTGNFKGRAINSNGTELMVLTKLNGKWKIRAIHWSSARRQPAAPAN
ncbi:MAG: nuclear transport factor 2 family protein [Gemmatimonadaceae bacterium]|nr:nuclear transport factor 2 family protein [Gemmatimonadaceae bacterium]